MSASDLTALLRREEGVEMRIYKVMFNCKMYVGREDVSLWVAAKSPTEAMRKALKYARKHFDDKRAVCQGAMLVGTVDVL